MRASRQRWATAKIDDLLMIVTQSVDAYRVCKERINAVKAPLQIALSAVDEQTGTAKYQYQ